MIRTRNGVEDTRTKRTTSSAACMDPERIRKAKDILSWTLMLKLDPAGKPYRRLDVVLALASTALFKDNFDCLECLWPPSRNAEWYVTLSNEESNLKLINEEIKVNGKYGHFLPAGSSEYRARIHWLPRWIDNGTPWRALQAYKGVETPITSSWAEEITDKELGQWVTSSEAERRRRRQEKRDPGKGLLLPLPIYAETVSHRSQEFKKTTTGRRRHLRAKSNNTREITKRRKPASNACKDYLDGAIICGSAVVFTVRTSDRNQYSSPETPVEVFVMIEDDVTLPGSISLYSTRR
ncbi:hypothetical protein LSH36_39g16040 [Paralvinella palmiformis]|uniref:Uncharacterized protein n=1 Tax=Paralvinella palmiformis TaxID=53620 RepID=A0AAD9K8M9_9ANNE|nr:hypothetical protein LSH36_39g16040 [Paralvinella palmiformis]